MLLVLGAPGQLRSLAGQEHGRTIPLADMLAGLRHSGFLCCESGVGDRHNCAVRSGRSFNVGVEFFRERLDYPRTEPGFWLGKDAVRSANAIISD